MSKNIRKIEFMEENSARTNCTNPHFYLRGTDA